MTQANQWIRLKALIVKEMLAVLYDKKTRISLIMPPLVQLLIFSHAATLEVKNIHMAIYNEDSGYYAAELIQRIHGSPYVTDLQFASSMDELHHMIDTQKAIVALHIPMDFSKRAMQGQATAQMILDGRKSNSSQIVSGYVTQIVQQFNAELLQQRGGAEMKQPVVTEFRAWFNPNLDYIWYNIPCLFAVLVMILVLTITSLSVAREREMGTFDQLLVSPLQPWQILLGKSVPALVIGVAEATFIMSLGLILFGIPFKGSVLALYFATIVFVVAITGVGLFISSLSRTQQQANLGTFVFMVPTMLISGYSTPIENMVDWLQPVSWFMPLRHFLRIVKGIFLKDMPFSEVLLNTWPIALIAVFTLSVAGWMFSRRLE